DGGLDLVVGNLGAESRVYSDIGQGVGAGISLGHTERVTSVAIGDLDGDGHKDIITGSFSPQGLSDQGASAVSVDIGHDVSATVGDNARVTAGGDFALHADSTTDVAALSGDAASGERPSVGGAFTHVDIERDVTARVGGSTVTAGDIVVDA